MPKLVVIKTLEDGTRVKKCSGVLCIKECADGVGVGFS